METKSWSCGRILDQLSQSAKRKNTKTYKETGQEFGSNGKWLWSEEEKDWRERIRWRVWTYNPLIRSQFQILQSSALEPSIILSTCTWVSGWRRNRFSWNWTSQHFWRRLRQWSQFWTYILWRWWIWTLRRWRTWTLRGWDWRSGSQECIDQGDEE